MTGKPAKKPRAVLEPHPEKGWPTRVYVFAAPHVQGKKRVDPPKQAMEQLWLANLARNYFVECSHRKDAAVKAAWSTVPEVAACEEQIAAAEAAWSEAADAIDEERIRQRTRFPDCPDLIEAQKAASKAARAARAARKAAMTAAKGTPAGDAAKELVSQATREYDADVKAAYRIYSQEMGLYHATLNAVRDDAREAEQRVIKARMEGRPAARHFKPFNGTGRLSVGLQRSAGSPPRKLTDCTPEGRWKNVLRLPQSNPVLDRAGKGPRPWAEILFTIGRDREPIILPVEAHRVIPPEADICGAELVVNPRGSTRRFAVHVTVKVPPPVISTLETTMAVHIGWRRIEGGVRVMSWRATAPVTVTPQAAAAGVRQITPTSGDVIIPDSVFTRLDATRENQSARDIALDEIREQVVAWLKEHDPVPWIGRDGEETELTAADVARWRSPKRFVVLTNRWLKAPPEPITWGEHRTADGQRFGVPVGEGIVAKLYRWEKADKIAWNRVEHGRAKVLDHRKARQRNVAAWIASVAGVVAVDDTDYAEIKSAKPRIEVPSQVEAASAQTAQFVAPGEWRSTLKTTCAREGVQVTETDHAGVSTVHAACGHQNEWDSEWLSQEVVCQGCGRTFDQDLNAVALTLQRVA